MEIKITTENKLGQIEHITYQDVESDRDFKDKKIKGCRAYCFYKEKFVIVYTKSKDHWTPPGGGVEEGETVRDTVRREVKEETNMEVTKQRLMGLFEVERSGEIEYFTTSVCLVESSRPFVADPDGDITEIKLIDFKDYKPYSDIRLPTITDHMMLRALEIKAQLQSEVDFVK